MGKRASDRAGKCKTCGTTFNQGDQINLGKKPDGNWAVCPNDECYNGQISGKINTPPPPPKDPKTGTLNNFTKKPSKSADDCAAMVFAFHNTVGKYAWDKIEELFKEHKKSADLTQKIISWEGLLKVYAVVWSGKNLE